MNNDITLTMYTYEMAGGLRTTQSTAFAFQGSNYEVVAVSTGIRLPPQEDKQCACFRC
jgi:hypothetical protein